MSYATITVLPPVGKEKVVICLESGHSALVAKKGGKGTDISSRFQQKAALMGCIIRNMVEVKQEEKPAKDQVITSIIEAIKKLQPDEYSAGYPNLEAVIKQAGFKVSQSQLTKAWTAFQQEAMQ
ncbi:hypothetical protein [Entomomonas asaccharolytica]|uniref:Uncharacterized protein n=1 Tax=Entomomonas asaccharolytica TaxID=2785331 RepID=A0A974NEA7_9GAMM|nr:hypothetical protein [Entomomonas asaccharolytica]QQP85015.1 hypothetical protein JHT90_11540 [Entomomonas asaccharolytica]